MSDAAYVISSRRATLTGNVVFGIVTDNLQRLNVQMPSARTSDAEVDATIRATLAGLAAKPTPVA